MTDPFTEQAKAMAALSAENGVLRAEIEQQRALVKELAEDLEEELRGHYGPVLDYPSERRRFERDMTSVYKARAALIRLNLLLE